MRVTLTLRRGSQTSNHQLELHATGDGCQAASRLTITLDGEVGAADYVPVAPGTYSILLGGRSYEVQVASLSRRRVGDSTKRIVTLGAQQFTVEVHDPRRRRGATAQGGSGGPQEIFAPMPGKIVQVLVETNQVVEPGAGLLVIEAMKMQNELRAPRGGKIAEICVSRGDAVEAGTRLVRLV